MLKQIKSASEININTRYKIKTETHENLDQIFELLKPHTDIKVISTKRLFLSVEKLTPELAEKSLKLGSVFEDEVIGLIDTKS